MGWASDCFYNRKLLCVVVKRACEAELSAVSAEHLGNEKPTLVGPHLLAPRHREK